MLPYIYIGEYPLNLYRFSLACAVMLGSLLVFRRLRNAGFSQSQAFNALLVGYFLVTAGPFLLNFAFQAVLNGITGGSEQVFEGSTVLGVITALILYAALYARAHSMPIGAALDLVVPVLPLAQAIGRIGCLMAGCCYGKVTSSAWGAYLPDDQGRWALRHPTQLISSAVDLLIFALLITLERFFTRRPPTDRPFPGFYTLLYLLLYTAKRFLVEFLRGDGTPLPGGLTIYQVYVALAFALSTGLMAIGWMIHRRKVSSSPQLSG